ncbi:hypothetical protein ZWY2020_017810 [Hordeum vulgare]|nr:hypothetical protein ZWY2020_017810 [Hordeum vulgare]
MASELGARSFLMSPARKPGPGWRCAAIAIAIEEVREVKADARPQPETTTRSRLGRSDRWQRVAEDEATQDASSRRGNTPRSMVNHRRSSVTRAAAKERMCQKDGSAERNRHPREHFTLGHASKLIPFSKKITASFFLALAFSTAERGSQRRALPLMPERLVFSIYRARRPDGGRGASSPPPSASAPSSAASSPS